MSNINDLRLNQALLMQQSSGAAATAAQVTRPKDSGASFETLLQEQLDKNSKSCELQFSKHAQQRVNQRGIEMTDTLMQDLTQAVDKAQAKLSLIHI